MRLMFTFVLTLVLFGPGAAPSRSLGNQETEIPKGQVVKTMVCRNNSSQSYALYPPSNYTPERKWPILYAFDPRARGQLPVERFRDAAEKYGWIVVGSNNSRNGPLPPSVDAWNAMVADTHARFAIDDERVYVTGMSGGARLAIRIISLCHECAAGVIAFAAGFPPDIAPASSMHYLFFGAAGVEDFNFPELRKLDEPLTKAGIRHHIQVFDGRHEWGPAPVATQAVEWMELQWMKSGKGKANDALVSALWQQRLQQAASLLDEKRTYDAYQLYSDLMESFAGLRDVGDIEKKLAQMRNVREVKDAIRDEERQIGKQRDIESQIDSLIAAGERQRRQANNSRDVSGDGRGAAGDEGSDPDVLLHIKLASLRKQSKGPKDDGDRRIARRVLEGLFVGLYEQGVDLLQTQKLYDSAIRSFILVTEVNPDRPGGFFYLAWAYAANGEKKRSLQALRTAIEKGFSDLATLNDNRAFDSFRNDPQYLQIVGAMKPN